MESRRPPQTDGEEYFSGVDTVQQLTERYASLTSEITESHDYALSMLAGDHRTQFGYELAEPGSTNIQFTLRNTLEMTQERLKADDARVSAVIDAGSATALSLLSDRDQGIFDIAYRRAREYGVDHLLTRDVLRSASDTPAYIAMRLAMDSYVLEKAKRRAAEYGVGHLLTRDVLRSASSPNAASVIRAALDSVAFRRAQRCAKDFGVKHLLTRNALSDASSPNAKDAMRTALDKTVFEQVLQRVKGVGVQHIFTRDALSGASSPEVRQVFERAIEDSDSQRRTWHGGTTRGAANSGSQQHQQRTSTERERIRQETEAQQAERVRREQKKQKEAEARRIVDSVVSKDKSASWLRGEPLTNIIRVINTVRMARERADETGEPITDKDIYIQYRKKIEVINGEESDQQRLNGSFKIISAMMGGDKNGTFPF